MNPQRRDQAPPTPSAEDEAGSGEAGAGALENGAHTSVKYGRKQLEALYEISKLLTRFWESTEQTVSALVSIINRELPLRSAVFIEKTPGRPKTITWPFPGTSAPELRAAEVRAMKAFLFLTRPEAPAAAEAGVPARAGEAGPAERGKFITCPLIILGHPIYGVLHLEGLAPFDEEDAQFASAVVNQLSIVLGLSHTSRLEISLRKQAEGSQRQAEVESANRRRAEEEVRRLNSELELRVAERTVQFRETIKELDAFTYSIAHDLRAPLRHIHGFSELLLLGSGRELAIKTYAPRIMAAAESMDVLLTDLLTYSRLTLEEVRLGPVSLANVMDKVRTVMEIDLVERHARLDVDGPLPRVVGDEVLLTQAVLNLVSNAIKFTAPGVEPRVRVRTEAHNGLARLWVEDNGIGIAPEYQERIFGVFQRLHKVEEYPGTGIGLAIVRRALERMRGRAGVESVPGQGSRFWIELAKSEDGL